MRFVCFYLWPIQLTAADNRRRTLGIIVLYSAKSSRHEALPRACRGACRKTIRS